jgi:hypothetical protein
LLGAVEVEPEVEPDVVVPLLVLPFVAVLLVELGAAEAPAMPAAAPPAASAPATIVAPSIFEMFIGVRPPWGMGSGPTLPMLARPAKQTSTPA